MTEQAVRALKAEQEAFLAGAAHGREVTSGGDQHA